MAVEVFKNVLTKSQIEDLLNYFQIDDHHVDDRFDVRSKAPSWNDQWPKQSIEKELEKILRPYDVETVVFNSSKISFRLHVDTGTGHEKLYKNVLIPMSYMGKASTVFFNNYWHKKSTRFSRSNISPFRYNMFDKHGNMVWVDDIRILLEQCKTNSRSVTDFVVDDQFIQSLEDLVKKRYCADERTSNYSDVVNYDPSKKFDVTFHEEYLNHIPIDDLHGLSIDRVYNWSIGDIVIFDRIQLHCAGAGHTNKVGLSLFLNLK